MQIIDLKTFESRIEECQVLIPCPANKFHHMYALLGISRILVHGHDFRPEEGVKPPLVIGDIMMV